jgi:hypothetical protein
MWRQPSGTENPEEGDDSPAWHALEQADEKAKKPESRRYLKQRPQTTPIAALIPADQCQWPPVAAR